MTSTSCAYLLQLTLAPAGMRSTSARDALRLVGPKFRACHLPRSISLPVVVPALRASTAAPASTSTTTSTSRPADAVIAARRIGSTTGTFIHQRRCYPPHISPALAALPHRCLILTQRFKASEEWGAWEGKGGKEGTGLLQHLHMVLNFYGPFSGRGLAEEDDQAILRVGMVRLRVGRRTSMARGWRPSSGRLPAASAQPASPPA
ncbi:hypothetical protein C8R45DRAFT_296875 [Mycena sanguinolenta]|nr:hypothetical protein C8R45DRAFT_296875 [Mycena sanguinolenta]